jgi:formylglycine-generating enzyme required for sulfatase activity
MTRVPLVLGGLAGAVLLAGGAATAVRAARRDQERAERRVRGMTELRVRNPAGAALRLYRGGGSLAQAEALGPVPSSTWLEEGNYFLEARRGSWLLHYPVPVRRSRLGPDSLGSFAVTVRDPGRSDLPGPAEGFSPFAFIPSGHFEMGDRNNPGQSHYVWLGGFFMGTFEVTNGEFRRFLADPQGYDDRPNWTEAGWQWKAGGASQATARLPADHPRYPRFGRDELPVVLVTWYEAAAYCRWLTRRLGGGHWLFRLPTEGEWEKAARGPDTFDFGLGMELSEPQAGRYNWKKNPDAPSTLVSLAESQGAYAPNRYGLRHVSGNAAEWTGSLFRHYNRERPYREDDRNHEAASGMRVTRGGSWYSANNVRLSVAYREEFQPELSSDDLGFRVAAVADPGGLRR